MLLVVRRFTNNYETNSLCFDFFVLSLVFIDVDAFDSYRNRNWTFSTWDKVRNNMVITVPRCFY